MLQKSGHEIEVHAALFTRRQRGALILGISRPFCRVAPDCRQGVVGMVQVRAHEEAGRFEDARDCPGAGTARSADEHGRGGGIEFLPSCAVEPSGFGRPDQVRRPAFHRSRALPQGPARPGGHEDRLDSFAKRHAGGFPFYSARPRTGRPGAAEHLKLRTRRCCDRRGATALSWTGIDPASAWDTRC